MPSVSESSTLAGVYKSYLNDLLSSMFVHIPARVTTVDYDKGFVNAKPLIKLPINSLKVVEQEEILEIPVTLPMFDDCSAYLTFPIKENDVVIVLMSERDTANLMVSDGSFVVSPQDNRLFGLYPIGCMPLRLFNKTVSIDKEAVVLKYGTSVIKLSEDKISIFGSTEVDVKSSSDVTVNGATITPEGDVITADGVSLNNHTHNGGSKPDQ